MNNVMVYGGCVTRDSLRYLSSNLVAYIARQSLISGMAPATRPPESISLTSSFQRRAVLGDFESSLRTSVATHSNSTDLLLMDILADRFGVFRVLGGGFLTRSAEFAQAKLESKVVGRRDWERFGTDTHFSLWEDAAQRFNRLLKETNLKHKALVIETPWANLNELGEPTQKAVGFSAADANELYSRYYALLRELGFEVRRVPDDLAVANSRHKWGESPFHYIDDAYAWIAQQGKLLLNGS